MSIAVMEICDILQMWTWPDHAPSMHAEIAKSLSRAGFAVELEYPVANIGNGRRGRIDLVARSSEGNVAIELDTRRPRAKSILKLNTFDGFRIIGLRGVQWVEKVPGIDAIIGLRVRQARASEIADRRTVNRPIWRRENT